MTNLAKSFSAGLAGIAMIAAVSVAVPTEAQAGNGQLFGAFASGLVLGAIASNGYGYPVYSQPYVTYQPHCWWKKQFVGYNYYGQPVYQSVQVCA